MFQQPEAAIQAHARNARGPRQRGQVSDGPAPSLMSYDESHNTLPPKSSPPTPLTVNILTSMQGEHVKIRGLRVFILGGEILRLGSIEWTLQALDISLLWLRSRD